MKKIYKKPILAVESFVTDEVMSQVNVLSEANNNQDSFGDYQNAGQVIFNKESNAGNILNSINYDTFTQ